MATIQDQQQSVWADEEQFPADILRLCFSALDESCSDWPERKVWSSLQFHYYQEPKTTQRLRQCDCSFLMNYKSHFMGIV